MVLANRLNLIHILLIVFATTSCLAEETIGLDCSAELILSEFIKENSNWKVVDESEGFSPIQGLRVLESRIWISTYGADFFPVKVKSVGNAILIENIRFLRSAPIKIHNDPAELVKVYKAKGVLFTIQLTPNNCEIKGKLQIEITNLQGKNNETVKLVRFEGSNE
ncbi:hypothetical protein JL49_25015 [Pseudoalteromonas luteoviolacea]|nr:hypothetical protein JL49_25015 [Pseudoalteromonas luteoviolacea]